MNKIVLAHSLLHIYYTAKCVVSGIKLLFSFVINYSVLLLANYCNYSVSILN